VADIVINSGFAVSSAFQVPRTDRPFYVGSPGSHAGQLTLQFAPTLDAQSGDFRPLYQAGTGLPYVVANSGNFPAWTPVTAYPTGFCRLASAVAVPFPTSFAILGGMVF